MLLQLSQHCNNIQSPSRLPISILGRLFLSRLVVLKISNNILWAFEKQSVMSLVAIDLSAAFNTVDHAILLGILNNKYGITEQTLKWFDSYLRPRSFKVVIDNKHYSKEHNLEVSVPQGSCAGANIFNLYCSPVQDVVPKGLKPKWLCR